MIDAFHDSPFLNLPGQRVYLSSQVIPPSEFKKKHQRHYKYNQCLGNAKTGVHKQHQLIGRIMQAAGKLWL